MWDLMLHRVPMVFDKLRDHVCELAALALRGSWARIRPLRCCLGDPLVSSPGIAAVPGCTKRLSRLEEENARRFGCEVSWLQL